MGRWNGHVFTIKPDVIRGFKDLTIKGGSETEEKKNEKKGYVTRKGGSPREVTLTVMLDHRFNVDVRNEAMSFVNEAVKGKKAYMYIGSGKLMSCKLMLTDCDVDTIEIAPNNTWVSAECKLSFKQASKGSDGDGDKKKKKSSKKKKPAGGSPKKKEPTIWDKIAKKMLIIKRRRQQKDPTPRDPNKKDKYVVLR